MQIHSAFLANQSQLTLYNRQDEYINTYARKTRRNFVYHLAGLTGPGAHIAEFVSEIVIVL